MQSVAIPIQPAVAEIPGIETPASTSRKSIMSNYGVDQVPTPVGNPGYGILTSSTRVLFPSDWAGRITIGKNYDPRGSKIEASFSPPNYVPDVDISYVNGYSVPISCSCSGVTVSDYNIRTLSLPLTYPLPTSIR